MISFLNFLIQKNHSDIEIVDWYSLQGNHWPAAVPLPHIRSRRRTSGPGIGCGTKQGSTYGHPVDKPDCLLLLCMYRSSGFRCTGLKKHTEKQRHNGSPRHIMTNISTSHQSPKNPFEDRHPYMMLQLVFKGFLGRLMRCGDIVRYLF